MWLVIMCRCGGTQTWSIRAQISQNERWRQGHRRVALDGICQQTDPDAGWLSVRRVVAEGTYVKMNISRARVCVCGVCWTFEALYRVLFPKLYTVDNESWAPVFSACYMRGSLLHLSDTANFHNAGSSTIVVTTKRDHGVQEGIPTRSFLGWWRLFGERVRNLCIGDGILKLRWQEWKAKGFIFKCSFGDGGVDGL